MSTFTRFITSQNIVIIIIVVVISISIEVVVVDDAIKNFLGPNTIIQQWLINSFFFEGIIKLVAIIGVSFVKSIVGSSNVTLKWNPVGR